MSLYKQSALLLVAASLVSCQGAANKPMLHPALEPPLALPTGTDGTIDYVAFLNERCAAGVTRENNAAVRLLAIVAPFKPGSEDAAKKILGISLDSASAMWVDYDTFRDTANVPLSNTLWDDIDAAERRKWTDADYPIVVKWLAAQSRALDAIAVAVQRPRYYVPMVSAHTPPTLLDCFMSGGLASYRSISNTFAARATHRLAAGDVDGFIADLNACHRIADLMAQRPFIIDQLVAVAIHATPSLTLAKLLERGELSGDALRRSQQMLDANPAPPADPKCLDIAERAFTADLLQMCRRGRLRDARTIMVSPLGASADLPVGDLDRVDWSVAEKFVNAEYDNEARLLALHDREQFRKSQNQWETAYAALQLPDEDFWFLPATTSVDPVKTAQANTFLRLRSGESRTDYSVRMAAYLFGDNNSRMRLLAESQRMRLEAVRTALAVAAYRAVTGRFPGALADLVPKYLAAVPEDWFSGKPLMYKMDGGDVVVYSIGNDEKDDGGKIITTLNGGDTGARVKGINAP